MLRDYPELADAASANLIDFGFEESRISFDMPVNYMQEGDYQVNLMSFSNVVKLMINVVINRKSNWLTFTQVTDIPIACSFNSK